MYIFSPKLKFDFIAFSWQQPNEAKRDQTRPNKNTRYLLSMRSLSLRLRNLNSFYYLYVIICTSLRVFPPPINSSPCSLSLSLSEKFSLSSLSPLIYTYICTYLLMRFSRNSLSLSLSIFSFILPFVFSLYISNYL